ncbi:MAG: hypothetical protein WBP72_11600, partial [Rhodocyclaceae bacterium]
RYAYGHYCRNMARQPLEYDDQIPDAAVAIRPATGLRRSLAFLDNGLRSLRSAWDRRISAPRRYRYLRRALSAYSAVDGANEYAGQAAYWAGLIVLRGLRQGSALRAREHLAAAAERGVPEGAFELALLLLDNDGHGGHCYAKGLLERALPGLRSASMVDRTLFELAWLEKTCSDTGVPDLEKAHEYLGRILERSGLAVTEGGEIVAATRPAGPIAREALRAEARLMYQEVSDTIKAEADRRLAQAERARREAVENMMAMFAHQFRGSVGTILFNAEHQHDERLYLSIAHSMTGLLETFSVVSTSPEKLLGSLKDDSSGEGSPAAVLLRALKLALVQLLSTRNRRRMSPHYFAYAKRRGEAPAELRLSEWSRDRNWQTRERQMQSQWEEDFGALIVDADLDTVCAWIGAHVLPVRVEGFPHSAARFAQFGPKASLLTVVFTEVLVNAFKHTTPGTHDALVVTWTEEGNEITFSCTNPSTKETRMREASKGSGRGHKFLGLIAEHLHGRFSMDVFTDTSCVRMSMPVEIMHLELAA